MAGLKVAKVGFQALWFSLVQINQMPHTHITGTRSACHGEGWCDINEVRFFKEHYSEEEGLQRGRSGRCVFATVGISTVVKK